MMSITVLNDLLSLMVSFFRSNGYDRIELRRNSNDLPTLRIVRMDIQD